MTGLAVNVTGFEMRQTLVPCLIIGALLGAATSHCYRGSGLKNAALAETCSLTPERDEWTPLVDQVAEQDIQKTAQQISRFCDVGLLYLDKEAEPLGLHCDYNFLDFCGNSYSAFCRWCCGLDFVP